MCKKTDIPCTPRLISRPDRKIFSTKTLYTLVENVSIVIFFSLVSPYVFCSAKQFFDPAGSNAVYIRIGKCFSNFSQFLSEFQMRYIPKAGFSGF